MRGRCEDEHLALRGLNVERSNILIPLLAALPEAFAPWDICALYPNPSGGVCLASGSPLEWGAV